METELLFNELLGTTYTPNRVQVYLNIKETVHSLLTTSKSSRHSFSFQVKGIRKLNHQKQALSAKGIDKPNSGCGTLGFAG
jgi:hypothetical protein